MPRAVKYAVIDAFTDLAFKGNPAAVCFLESGQDEDEEWMQNVAKEFNISETCFLYRMNEDAASIPRFSLRWFTPVAEVDLCGHATVAATHFLLTLDLVKCNIIEFATKSGLLFAKKVSCLKHLGVSKPNKEEVEEKFAIELDFPIIPLLGCDSSSASVFPKTLSGASVVGVCTTGDPGELILELNSWEDLLGVHPNLDEIRQCTADGLIITSAAPTGSGYDFYTRYFCPKFGIDEDPVCGSAHCALAPYWSKKLGKNRLIAYMASPRGGRLDLQLDEEKNRVYIRGEAVTVMVGTVVV